MRLNPQQNGHNVKKVVSQRLMTHETRDGSKTNYTDIFSAIRKDENSRLLRHMSVKKNTYPEKKSTVLVRMKGENVEVLESSFNGVKEKKRKFKLKNPKSIKTVFNKQSLSAKGVRKIENQNIHLGLNEKKLNNQDLEHQINEKENNNYYKKSKNNKNNRNNRNNRNNKNNKNNLGVVSFIKKSVKNLFDTGIKKSKKQLKKERQKQKYNKNEFKKKQFLDLQKIQDVFQGKKLDIQEPHKKKKIKKIKKKIGIRIKIKKNKSKENE